MDTKQILKELETRIQDIQPNNIDQEEVGYVISVSDGVAKISGIRGCMMSEMLDFGDGQKGVALNLEEDTVGAIILGDESRLAEGQEVRRTKQILSIPVDENIIGRVVDPMLKMIDGGAPLSSGTDMPLERIAPGVMERQPVTTPMHTGIKAVDALTPIGRGQRQLIIGDRGTGKSTIATDTILNQKGQDMRCIYVAIGQKNAKVMRTVELFKNSGAMEYTTVVHAGASDNPALLYLAPYSGIAIAEYFMNKGEDVLIVFDDLSKHANAYREISLLLRRPPGREAYPGDVFYAHSRLLERACRLSKENGGGSITALPIVETQAGDVSAYIPTNVISITDGQVFLESALFNKGIRPGINTGLSVSRVGGSAQRKSTKKNSGGLKLQLAQYRELASFSQFEGDLDAETKAQLERGKRATQLMTQAPNAPISAEKQVFLLAALDLGAYDGRSVEDVSLFEKEMLTYLETEKIELQKALISDWNDDLKGEVKEVIEIIKERISHVSE